MFTRLGIFIKVNFSGAFGGLVSCFVAYPLSTITVRLQVQASSKCYSSTLDGFIKILEKEGWKGLYSGLSSALFGITVTQGIFYILTGYILKEYITIGILFFGMYLKEERKRSI